MDSPQKKKKKYIYIYIYENRSNLAAPHDEQSIKVRYSEGFGQTMRCGVKYGSKLHRAAL